MSNQCHNWHISVNASEENFPFPEMSQLEELQKLLGEQNSDSEQKPLLEFRGRLVHSDPRRGKVRIVHVQDVPTLQWLTRPSDESEPRLNLSLFPGSASWSKVPECKDGRVYVLKMTGSNVKYFFWMQEPLSKESEDANISKKFNEILNNPANSFQSVSRAPNVTAPAVTTPAARTPASNANTSAPVDVSNLVNSLRSILRASGNTNNNSEPLCLSDVLDPDRVLSALNEHCTAEERSRLFEHLPEGQRGDLAPHIRSAQFRQTLVSLSEALNSHQFGGIMASFGLPISGDGFGVEGFLDSVQKSQKK